MLGISSKEESVACILCAGASRMLLDIRKLLLERAGYHVVTVTNERALLAACGMYHLNLVVIGQSLTPRVKRLIASIVRDRCQSTKILELYSPHAGPAVDDADSWLKVPVDVPSDFIEHVNALVKRQDRLAS